MPANPLNALKTTQLPGDVFNRPIQALALGASTAFSLSAGSPSDNVGPFDDAVILRVVSKIVVRIAQAVAPEENPEDYAPQATDPILPPNVVQWIHLPAGEMFGVLRDGADATGTITVMR